MASEILGSVKPRGPLTQYDLLGYLVPGGVLLAAIGGFEAWARSVARDSPAGLHTPIVTAAKYLSGIGGSSPPGVETGRRIDTVEGAVLQLAVLVGAALATYVLGHVIASVSAFLLDRVYVHRAHRYPFQRLVGSGSPETSKENFYRAFLVWLNAYLLTRYLGIDGAPRLGELLPAPLGRWFSQLSHWPNEFILWFGLGTSSWEFFAVATELAISYLILAKVVLSGRDFRTQFANGEMLWVKRLFGKYLDIAAAIPRFLSSTVGRYINARQELSPATKAAFFRRLSSVAGFSVPTGDSSAYWLTVIHLRRAEPELMGPIDNWMSLYSFARNVATAFWIAFCYCLIWWSEHRDLLPHVSTSKAVLFLLPLAYLIASFVMLLRYYYLYSDYYSKYLIRALLVSATGRG